MTIDVEELIGLGYRQRLILKALTKQSPLRLSKLSLATYGSAYRAADTRRACESLVARGLVSIERGERATFVTLIADEE